MANFEIIVGSMLGASEYVADALQEVLQQAGHNASIHLQPEISSLNPAHSWIICTSTHGAGELPDNIQPFAEQLNQISLPGTEYLVVGLGDSSYDTFCNGAHLMQQAMNHAGATLIAEPLLIDVLIHPIPEQPASEWLQDWLAK